MPCSCRRCKYQIIRKRRICEDHVRTYGEFPQEQVSNLRFESSSIPVGDQEAHQNTGLQSDIRPQIRRRVAYDLGEATTQPSNATPELDEPGMDDMLESFYDNNMFEVPGDEHPNVMGSNRAGGSIDTEEERMRTLARLPLFNSAKISVLRASLALLNLQSLFGWSDNSVDALLK